MKISDIRALVCGGSTGIGYAIAEELARLNYQVTILSKDPKNLEKASARIEKTTGRKVKSLCCDLEHLDQLQQ
jgi:3-oxoacyl-[acyl-carrier protein] reductase